MRCPTCQRAHIYHFCSFCMRCHICHFPIAIWSQNLGIGTIFEPNLPFKTGCNKFQMESVKMKKATKTVAFRQLAIYCNIVDNQLLTDAAYRTTWIWKSCVLNGRKAFSRLFFRSKNRPFCCTFHLNQNQRENSLFTSEVHLFSIRCEGTKISGIFTNWCQLKARCSHEDFAAKRINRQYHW